ncbi:MAG: hypothetical protein AAGC55_19595 [Myxococcota bacterium]
MIAALLDLLALPPDRLGRALTVLIGLLVVWEYSRISLQLVAPRSVAVHLLCGVLTLVPQTLLLGAVLIVTVQCHPERIALNAVWVAVLYLAWYLAGQSTLLVRRDSQGADPGFMWVSAVLVYTTGLITLLVSTLVS